MHVFCHQWWFLQWLRTEILTSAMHLEMFGKSKSENTVKLRQMFIQTCVNGICILWFDFKSFMDPATPADPLLKHSGFSSLNNISSGLAAKLVPESCWPSGVKWLQCWTERTDIKKNTYKISMDDQPDCCNMCEYQFFYEAFCSMPG